MRTTILRGFLGMAALLASAHCASAGTMPWRRSLPAAQAEAKQSHKLLMVEFTTVSCGFCKKMDAETYADPSVIQLGGKVVPIKLDAEREGNRLAQKYGVEVFPTILFLNETGGVEGVMNGFVPTGDFTQTFNAALKRHQAFVAARDRFQKNNADAKAAFELVECYATQGNAVRALAMQKQVERLDATNEKGLLSRSCLYLGDFYAAQNRFDKAAALYRQSLRVARTPLDRAYGHLSLANGSLTQKHYQQAVPELKAVRAVPHCPAELKDSAQKLITALREQGFK